MNTQLAPMHSPPFAGKSEGTFAAPARYIRFGVFHLDLRKEELLKDGMRVKLQGKVYQALLALLERPGEVVTRVTLRMRLWPSDTHVNYDANVNTTVNKLRQVLGDSPDQPVFVDTIPRKGYSFVAPIEYLDQPAAPPSRTTILGEVGLIYASQESLVLASPHYWWWDSDGNADWTYVHRFDLTQGAPKYAASGGFEGHPVSQFSLDIDKGHLRAAVNTQQVRMDDKGSMRWDRSSFARVLDASLREVGSLERLSGLIVERRHARLRVAIDDREVDLLLVGVEVQE